MNDHSNDPFDELMRRSLAEEADRIEPTDALPEILNRAHAVRRPVVRRPWVVTAGLAAVGTAAAVGAFTVFNGNLNTANEGDSVAGPGTVSSASGTPVVPPDAPREQPTTMPSQTPSDQASPRPDPKRSVTEQAVSDKPVAVYWLGNANAGRPTTKPSVQSKLSTRLYRTWTRVSGRPAYEAVDIMTSQQPDDADYYSVWKGAKLKSVTTDGDVITVDFERFPAARVDPPVAEVAAQQLVYTVQGALGESTQPVQVLHRGRAGDRLFGQIDTSAPLLRAQAADVRALVSIESPAEGTLMATGLVTVKGSAAAYEATVNYVATNVKTGQTFKSTVNTAEGQKFSPFSFELKLSPGQWNIEAFLLSGEDGSVSDLDTKTILVR